MVIPPCLLPQNFFLLLLKQAGFRFEQFQEYFLAPNTNHQIFCGTERKVPYLGLFRTARDAAWGNPLEAIAKTLRPTARPSDRTGFPDPHFVVWGCPFVWRASDRRKRV
jgi:hypothetical protein